MADVVVALACLTTVAAAADKPNVIVVLSDDQGWADVGFNNPNVYSPNLDALAAGGVTFLNHYVMPQCTPTRVALLTGRYPSRFGRSALSASNDPAFPLGTFTMAQLMKDHGYETSLTGKWHLGSSADHGPNHFGFESSYGSLAGAVGMYDHRYRTGAFEQTWHRDHELIPGGENGRHATDLVTDEAVRVIKRKRDTPFFLYVPFHAVHTPLDERGDFIDQPTALDPDKPGRWRNEDRIAWFNDPKGIIQRETDPEKRLLLAAVCHLDDAIGRIVKALDETGQRGNTLILFSSDNGPQGSWGGKAYPDDLKLTDFNQPLPMRGKKIDVWEGGIHVPGFANWPGTIEPKVVGQPVHVIDWMPTLASLLGHRPDAKLGWDGVDLLPVLTSDAVLADRSLYWTWQHPINRWAVRHGDWKIVHYGTDEPTGPASWQLFHLEDDPREARDRAADQPDILAAMHERFVEHRRRDAK
jgi:arylsulfatase A-like enzyme